MRRALTLFGPALAAGLVLAVLALGDRNEDPVFALDQQRLRALSAEALETAVQAAPEPRPDNQGRPARRVQCTPGAAGTALRNPWSCRAEYPSRVVRYTVRVEQDGDWNGVSRDGVRRVYGRIAVPGA